MHQDHHRTFFRLRIKSFRQCHIHREAALRAENLELLCPCRCCKEAELMYKLFDLVSGNLEEVNEYLDRMY